MLNYYSTMATSDLSKLRHSTSDQVAKAPTQMGLTCNKHAHIIIERAIQILLLGLKTTAQQGITRIPIGLLFSSLPNLRLIYAQELAPTEAVQFVDKATNSNTTILFAMPNLFLRVLKFKYSEINIIYLVSRNVCRYVKKSLS